MQRGVGTGRLAPYRFYVSTRRGDLMKGGWPQHPSEDEKTSGSTHSLVSAKRKLRFKKKRAAGHSIDCDSVPQGRVSRSEKRTVVPVTSKPTEPHHAARPRSPGHAPHRAYVRKLS